MRAFHQTNQQCSSPGVSPKFKALPINYSCCLMRKRSLRVGKAKVLPFPSNPCFKTSSSAKPGQGTPEEPPAAPGASQEFHLSIPTDPVRMPQPLPQKSRRCDSAQPSTFPPLRAAPLPLHPAQGLFPHPGTWRGLKAGANNGLNIVGGGRAAAAGCICPGHRAEEEACTCLAASLSAGNKSNKSPSVHPRDIL